MSSLIAIHICNNCAIFKFIVYPRVLYIALLGFYYNVFKYWQSIGNGILLFLQKYDRILCEETKIKTLFSFMIFIRNQDLLSCIKFYEIFKKSVIIYV